MKLLIFSSLIIAVTCSPINSEFDEVWKEWKTTYNKSYNNEAEEAIRRIVFEENMKKIEQHNFEHSLGKHSYTMGMNRFGDLTSEEFARLFSRFKKENETNGIRYMEPHNFLLPDTVDWRGKGAVTHVKQQGKCLSCWAFGVTGAIEGAHFKATGKLVSLSEQNLVDCCPWYPGCSWGWYPSKAFQYVADNGGIDTEASYPYVGAKQQCKFDRRNVGATISSFKRVPPNENALQSAVAWIGPISVLIDGNESTFQFYRSGVYDDPNCSSYALNHVVLVVGYGTMNGKEYWLAKNSWGTNWGEKGYIYMSRNKDNQCGITVEALYPII